MSYRQLFANRQFTLLFVWSTVAGLGNQMVAVALTLHIYAISGSAFSLAMGLSLMAVPWILVGPIAGIIADRTDRSRMIFYSQMCGAAAAASLAFTQTLPAAFIVCFISGCSLAAAAPASSALTPQIVAREQYASAVAVKLIAYNAARVLGPIIAGVVLAWTGPETTFLFTAVLLSLAGAVVWFIKRPRVEHESDVTSVIKTISSGFVWIGRSGIIKSLLTLFSLIIVAEALVSVNTVVYVERILDLGSETAGTLIGIAALGACIGAFIVSRLERTIQRRFLLVAGAILIPIPLLPIQLAPGIYIVAGLWFIHGLGVGAMDVCSSAFMMELVPDNWRGRVYSATNALCTVVVLVCNPAVGQVTEMATVTAVFSGGGLIATVCIAVFGLLVLLPKLAVRSESG